MFSTSRNFSARSSDEKDADDVDDDRFFFFFFLFFSFLFSFFLNAEAGALQEELTSKTRFKISLQITL